MKKRIRLTEAQLYKLIRRALNENFHDALGYDDKAVQINDKEDLDNFLSQIDDYYAQRLMGRVKKGYYIVPVGYADQGGSLGDWYVISYFKKKHPKNIVVKNDIGGVWGYIFGKEDFLYDAIYEAVNGNTPFDVENEIIQEKIPEIAEYYGLQLDDELENILWGFLDEHICANSFDYSEDELKDLLSKNGYLGGSNPNESLAHRVTENIIKKLRRV